MRKRVKASRAAVWLWSGSQIGFWCAGAVLAQAAPPLDMAGRFGMREGIEQASLSPDGTQVAYLAPGSGQGSALFIATIGGNAPPAAALVGSGNPDRIRWCKWVSNARLVCRIYGVVDTGGLLPLNRLVAVDASGKNMRMSKTNTNRDSRDFVLTDGTIVDWLPDSNNSVLMSRRYVADDLVGSHIGTDKAGLGVDELDTATLVSKTVEAPRGSAIGFISDGNGTVRIMASQTRDNASGYDSGRFFYVYRKVGGREWLPLAIANTDDDLGFTPVAIEAKTNTAYGFMKKDGRKALYKAILGDKPVTELVLARPDVDIDTLVQIGRRDRVVGASYATDIRHIVYFDPDIAALARRLGKALPKAPIIDFVDSSLDEQKLLIRAGSDNDPGTYYRYDKATHELALLFEARPALVGQTLATVKPIQYPAADGTMIPGYLTLPPGSEGKRLPAIVLPHGGPAARDEWGFDWLSQFFAARGYAVLQPNFRGSTGYGDAWFAENGFKSWKTAVGDVLDGGRWLAREGIADPAKLSIVGWSYGGYAALQAAIIDPALFKAVVAIAPVTDLDLLRKEHRDWSDFDLVDAEIGSASQDRAASPARNATGFKAPVMLVHGTFDTNVGYGESKLMADRLTEAGMRHELVTFNKLDHNLVDSGARTEMLRKIDAFLTASGAR